MKDFEVYILSETAVTVEFGCTIDITLAKKIEYYNNYIIENPFSGFVTSVPAYCSLTLFYNPLHLIVANIPGKSCFEKIVNYLHELPSYTDLGLSEEKRIVKVPVCYENALAPDISFVAAYNNITVDQVITIHTNAVYHVFMIGFMPGFAYMGGMHKDIATPRKEIPRAVVQAGSVGIAGEQTGVYPLDSPGGWQIIGRTPLQFFDINRPEPSLLKAGDKVAFIQISKESFDNIAAQHANKNY